MKKVLLVLTLSLLLGSCSFNEISSSSQDSSSILTSEKQSSSEIIYSS